MRDKTLLHTFTPTSQNLYGGAHAVISQEKWVALFSEQKEQLTPEDFTVEINPANTTPDKLYRLPIIAQEQMLKLQHIVFTLDPTKPVEETWAYIAALPEKWNKCETPKIQVKVLPMSNTQEQGKEMKNVLDFFKKFQDTKYQVIASLPKNLIDIHVKTFSEFMPKNVSIENVKLTPKLQKTASVLGRNSTHVDIIYSAKSKTDISALPSTVTSVRLATEDQVLIDLRLQYLPSNLSQLPLESLQLKDLILGYSDLLNAFPSSLQHLTLIKCIIGQNLFSQYTLPNQLTSLTLDEMAPELSLFKALPPSLIYLTIKNSMLSPVTFQNTQLPVAPHLTSVDFSGCNQIPVELLRWLLAAPKLQCVNGKEYPDQRSLYQAILAQHPTYNGTLQLVKEAAGLSAHIPFGADNISDIKLLPSLLPSCTTLTLPSYADISESTDYLKDITTLTLEHGQHRFKTSFAGVLSSSIKTLKFTAAPKQVLPLFDAKTMSKDLKESSITTLEISGFAFNKATIFRNLPASLQQITVKDCTKLTVADVLPLLDLPNLTECTLPKGLEASKQFPHLTVEAFRTALNAKLAQNKSQENGNGHAAQPTKKLPYKPEDKHEEAYDLLQFLRQEISPLTPVNITLEVDTKTLSAEKYGKILDAFYTSEVYVPNHWKINAVLFKTDKLPDKLADELEEYQNKTSEHKTIDVQHHIDFSKRSDLSIAELMSLPNLRNLHSFTGPQLNNFISARAYEDFFRALLTKHPKLQLTGYDEELRKELQPKQNPTDIQWDTQAVPNKMEVKADTITFTFGKDAYPLFQQDTALNFRILQDIKAEWGDWSKTCTITVAKDASLSTRKTLETLQEALHINRHSHALSNFSLKNIGTPLYAVAALNEAAGKWDAQTIPEKAIVKTDCIDIAFADNYACSQFKQRNALALQKLSESKGIEIDAPEHGTKLTVTRTKDTPFPASVEKLVELLKGCETNAKIEQKAQKNIAIIS